MTDHPLVEAMRPQEGDDFAFYWSAALRARSDACYWRRCARDYPRCGYEAWAATRAADARWYLDKARRIRGRMQ